MSIEERQGVKGTYLRVRWEIGAGPNGERRRGAQTFLIPRDATPTQAKRVRAKATAKDLEMLTGDRSAPPPGDVTVSAYLANWLESRTGEVEPSTLYRYDQLLRLRVTPIVGSRKLADLSPADCEAVFAAMRAAGKAPNTVKLTRAVLNAALEAAVAWRLIDRNPLDRPRAAGRRRGTVAVSPARVWDRDEANRFLAAVAGDKDEALWRLLLLGGLRVGEALALRWDAVDWKRGEVAIRRTRTTDREGKPSDREGTKGGGSRTIALDITTMSALRDLRARQLADGEATERCFPGEDGGLRDNEGTVRRFKRLAEMAGLREIRLHDLRHSHASMLLAAGVNVKAVADRLGHSSPTMTLQIYAHHLPSMGGAAVVALEGFLRGEKADTG